MTSEQTLPETVEGLPNICGSEDLISEVTGSHNSGVPLFTRNLHVVSTLAFEVLETK